MTLGRKGLSVLIVMMMLFSSFMVMIPANMDGWNSDGVPDNILDGATEESGLADITSAADGQSPVNGPAKKAKGMMKVYVATNDVKELADFLSDYEFKGALGDKNNVRDEIAFLLLEIPIKALGTIMDLEGVIGVYEYMAPEYSSLEVEKIQSLLKKSPNFLQTLSAASEPAAWTGGYSGADVKIAVCDSGVDFAHPDLLGAYAKDTMIFEVDGEVLIESAGDGQTRIMVHSAVIEVNNETLVADAVGGEQEIPVRYKNIVDGTVSVYIDSNTTGFTVDISTGFITLTNPLNAGEELSTSYDYYFVQRNLVPGSYTVYKEGTAMTSGYTLDTSSGELTFSPALAAGDEISIDYDYYSPYYNWPIAFDPVSMDTYIASQGNPDNTFYANTSISGTGPFQSSHTIAIDGVSDFSAEEALGGEKLLSSETILSRNFDLQNLYVTRDPNNWYFGFPTRHGLTDKSYSIYIDVDGANSGGNFDPRGNLVDTNSSHSDEVNDVLYTLDDNYIISASTDKSLKIWDANSGIMISKLTGTELWGRSVKSIDISVNGTWLAGSDGATLIIWDITDIANPVLFKSFAIGGGSQSFPNSIISFSNDGEYMAIGDFGGYSFSVFLLDLITNTWLGPIVPATRPSARSGHAMVYESFGNLSVLFGGDDGALDNETWEYDADADTWIQTTGIVNPSERSGHAMAYDSDEKKIIMFGGNDGAFDNETWEYDVVTNTWTDVSGIVAPSPRSGHSMCYDSSKDKIILFGGTDAGGENDETWEYDVATRTWVNTGVTGPSARSGHAMAFEPELGFTVLFGGTDAGGENGETWKYKTGWINVTDNEGPSARSGHSMCYDSSLRVDKIVLFGGDDGDANGETWEMDISNTWTQVTKAAAPGARSGHAMAYDVINDVSVVFGGNDGALDSETWEYNSADNKAYSVGDVVTSIGFSPDGTILAAGTGKKEINLIEMATGNIEKLQGHTGDVTALAWSPGGTKIVSGAYDGEVKQWNLATKLSYNNITDHIGTINSVDWSSDGTKIITAGEDNYVRMYNAVAPYTMTSDNQGDSPINSVNFSSMGSYVSGSVDSKVGAWTSSGAYVRSFLANLPDYVIVVDYIRERSDYWSVDADGIVSSRNDTIENATFYTWNGASSSWDELNLMNETIGGEQAYRSFLDATNLKIENAFVDLLVPRDLFAGDPDMLEAEIFVTAKMGHVTDEVVITATGATATLEHNKVYPSMEYAMFRSYDLFLDDAASTILKEGVDYTLDLETGVITFTPPLNAGDTVLASYYYYKDVSHAQDTAPNDNNVPTTNVDWSDTVTSLSNFGKREILYYTVDLADVSLSGAYKFGFHPGDAQINRFGALGILVVDDNTKGVYEKVYVDLNNDKVFDNNDRAVYLGDETTDGDETTSIDIPSLGVLDGIADYSAGTLYFIADGMTPIPYSEVFSERHGVLDRHSLENWTEWRNAYVPKAGELVCLSGEFGYDEYDGIVLTHGTKSAAVIAGRGNPAIPKNTLGMAPNATIIPISNIDQEGNIFDAWYFAVEGYDGVPGTGDEAVIVNNGFNYPDIYEDGWDPYSHYADYISTEYAGGRTLFVSGVGNDGYGYGTLASPGACPGVLSVGSATDYYFKTQKGVDDEGNYPHSGDVAFYSSKGPSTLGIPKPDVIAIGTGVTDVALSGDGTDAYRGYNDPWVGSDYSCAAAVGVLGMVYEAYYDTTHAADAEVLLTPDNTTTITLKHSPVIADSLTLQINGTTTTDYSINLMNGVITFNNVILKDRWVNATVYQFYNEYPDAQTARSLLMSGADDMKNDVLSQGAGLINAENSIKMAERTDGLLVNPSSWVPGNFTGEEYESFVKLMAPGDKESQEFTIENRNGTVAADVDIDDGTFKKIGEYNEVFQHMVPGTLDFFKYIDILDKIPPSTELLKITAHASFEELDKNNDGILDPVPDLITDACTDFIYDMSVMDWTDLGADGEFDPTDYDEGNTFDTCDLLSNVLQVRVKDPLVRSHDGLFVKISPKGVMPVPGASEVYFIHWTICCEFYTKTDWDWLSLDQTSMTITEGTESTLTATISVPDNAEIGSYEGAIYLYEDQQPVVGELLADYPKYSASEELENISVTNNVVGETLTNSTSTLAHMNPYVTGTPSIKKIVTSPIPVVNESVFVATDPVGNETFNVGYTNILDYNLWVEEAGTLWWDLNPFVASFDLLTGDVVLSTGVGDTCTVYAWLNHTAVELTTPGDFTFVRDTGDVTLVSGPLIAGEYLIADYSYIGPPQFDVMDENVVNSTPSITHLANTYVVDTPANSPTIWKKTRPTEIVNQSVWVDGTVGETFNVGYTDILDYNLWVDDGTWWVLNPHLTSFDLATGDVVIDGWDLWAGCEVFAWLNLTPASPPVELTPSEYTLHPGNGTIVLDVPLLVAEYLTANYSYIRLETYNGVQLARGAGDESILGIDIYVNYTDLLTEGVGMDYTIDRETGYVTFTPAVVVRTMTTSYEWYDVMDIPIAKTENYVIKDGTWTIYNNGVPMTEYTMHPTTGILIFDEPLSPGDLITADYTYYGHVQTIPIMVNIPATKADFTFGGQTSFTVIDELVTDVDTTKIVGDNILVVNIYDVTRETVSTVPINTVPYEFVVQNYQIDLKNELLLFSTGVETEAEMAEVNPTKDNVISCTVYADGVPLTSDNYTWYVSGLIVFNGSYSPLQPGLTITTDYSYYNAKLDYRFLEHGSATNDRIVPGSHTFYMNGTPMLGNTEYNGFWDANSNYPTLSDATGNNEWYTVIVGGTQNLGSGPISFAIGDVVLHDGNRYWKNPQNYTSTDVETGKVVFYEDLYVPEPFDFWTSIGSYVPLDAVITADYSYYTKTNTANLDFVDFSEVDNVAVVPGSCVLMNGTKYVAMENVVDNFVETVTDEFVLNPSLGGEVNASFRWVPPDKMIVPGSYTIYDDYDDVKTTMTEGVDYSFEITTGLITFLGAYTPILFGHKITADYQYYHMDINQTDLDNDHTIPGTQEIWDIHSKEIANESVYGPLNGTNKDLTLISPIYDQTHPDMVESTVIDDCSIYQNNTYTYPDVITNQTVYGPLNGTEKDLSLIYLVGSNTVIDDCTIYLDNTDNGTTSWSVLVKDTNYTLDYTNGELNLTLSLNNQPGNANFTFHVFLNSTVEVNEWTTLVENTNYTLNYTNGELNLTSTLNNQSNDNIYTFHVFYNYTYTYLLQNGTDYILDLYNGTINFTGVYEPLIPDSVIYANYSYYDILNPGPDYTIDEETGAITYSGDYNPLHMSAVITANYSYYNIFDDAFLAFGGAADEAIVDGSFELTKADGTEITALIDGTDYTIDLSSEEITFINRPMPGTTISANYSYYNPADFNRVYSSNADPGYSFSYAKLNYNNIEEGTYVVRKGGTVLVEGTDYELDLETGIITFYTLLLPADEIYVDYTYMDNSAILFNNRGMEGGYGTDGGQAGDWRFFYMHIPDQGLNKNVDNLLKLYIDAKWNDKPSDIDIFVFGKADQTRIPETTDAIPSDRYGSYTLENKGGSIEENTYYTSTNGSQEIVITPLSGGLNVIALHNVLLNGEAPAEDISLEVGWLSMSTESLEYRSNSLGGEASIKMVSNREFADGMNVSAVGPATGEITTEMVYQDNLDIIDELSFYHGLTEGTQFHKAIKVESALTLDIHIWAEDEGMIPDLDLGICYDVNEDGIGQFEELVTTEICDFMSYTAYGYNPYYASCADWDADEGVKLINPPDGQYVITVLGYTVKSPPQPFFLEVKAIRAGVEGFGMEGDIGEDIAPQVGTYTTEEITDTYQTHTYTMSWNFPGSTADGEMGGVINIGPSTAPGIMTVLANVILDREAPIIIDPLPADQSTINNNMPIIMASMEDQSRKEIDADGVRLYVDGVDVTPLANINSAFDEEAGGGGYPRGTVTYTPTLPMSEGAHRVDLIAPDWTGNTATETWVFTIKTSSPKLVLDNPSEDMTYVNDEMFMVRGTVEVGSALVLKGLATDGLEIEGDGSFRAMVTLSEGENTLEMVATDVVGNSYKIQRDIILDTDVPDISSIRSSEGYITNTDTTSIQGKVSERGNMYINYVPVVVNSDGTFSGMVALNEGINTFHVQFEDYAGNYVDEWMNITRDSISPVIEIDIPTTVDEEIINITGKIIDGYSVKINGKIPSTETTRDGDIEFTKSLALSHGINTIVIEAVDEAGNVIELSYTLEYKKDYGTNYAAIGVMIALLIVGLVVGLFIAMGLWKERPEEEEVEPSEDIPVDEEGEEIEPDGELPEDMEAGEVEDADIEAFDETPDMDDEPAPDIDEDMIDGEEELTIVEHGDDVEAIPMEEGLPEEIESDVVEPSEEPMVEEAGEDVVEEPMPEEGTIEEAPDIEEVPEAEDIPEEGAIKEASDMEEAPKADETPEEGPDADDVEMDDTPDEVPEEDIKEASDIEDAPEAEDIPKAEPVADEPVAVDDVPEAPVEDEKIQRLKKAYEDGKISEELYEKNLAKLQGKE